MAEVIFEISFNYFSIWGGGRRRVSNLQENSDFTEYGGVVVCFNRHWVQL